VRARQKSLSAKHSAVNTEPYLNRPNVAAPAEIMASETKATSLSGSESSAEEGPSIIKRLNISRASKEFFDRVVKDGDTEVLWLPELVCNSRNLFIIVTTNNISQTTKSFSIEQTRMVQ
jgi:hypothetical protein